MFLSPQLQGRMDLFFFLHWYRHYLPGLVVVRASCVSRESRCLARIPVLKDQLLKCHSPHLPARPFFKISFASARSATISFNLRFSCSSCLSLSDASLATNPLVPACMKRSFHLYTSVGYTLYFLHISASGVFVVSTSITIPAFSSTSHFLPGITRTS